MLNTSGSTTGCAGTSDTHTSLSLLTLKKHLGLLIKVVLVAISTFMYLHGQKIRKNSDVFTLRFFHYLCFPEIVIAHGKLTTFLNTQHRYVFIVY